LEEQRPATVECELEGDRHPPGSWAVQCRDEARQLPDLPIASPNGLSGQWRLGRPPPGWARGVLDGAIERGCDTMPHAAPQEMVGTRLMGRADRRTNSRGQLCVEFRGLQGGEEAREYLWAGWGLMLLPCE